MTESLVPDHPQREAAPALAPLTRRQLFGTTAAAAAAILLESADSRANAAEDAAPDATSRDAGLSVRYCLNTSTLRRDDLGLAEKIALASGAGYDGIEPWIREIEDHVKGGGTLSDVKQRIADAGLTVDSAIGFASWIVDDETARRQALEQARREMDLVQQIGGARIAAPPAGATRQALADLASIAGRYRALLDVGREVGVVPQLELWGFSQTLSRLGEVVYVAIESGHPDACVLPDVYHIYKGGSDFAGLKLLSGAAVHVFHMNDYPAAPPREEINDGHRVYPGDGVAPLTQILQTLRATGFHGALSLELFNRDYWQQDPATVARAGLEKMRAAVEAAERVRTPSD